MVIFNSYVKLPEGILVVSSLWKKLLSGEVFGWQLESTANLTELGTQMICKMGRMIMKHPKTSKNIQKHELECFA